MKFLEIFRFELAYQARRTWVLLVAAALLVVSFLMTRDSAVADAMYEDYFVNAPFAIALTTVFGGILWLLIAPVVAGDAAARDVATGMHSLTWAAPLGKSEYLGGRFLAAFVLNALILLAVQAGILLAVYSPGVNPEVIGPFRPAGHLTAYAFVTLPNAFVATALQFFLALRSGRAIASYLGSLFLVFMGFFVATIAHWFVMRGLGRYLDPIGIHFVVEDLAHLWTPAERQTRLLRLEGFLLTNRLLWTGVGLVVLAATWTSFRFAHRVEPVGWWRRRARSRAAQAPTPSRFGVALDAPVAAPRVSQSFGPIAEARKVLAIAGSSLRSIVASWAGVALFVVVPLMTVLVVVDQMSALGVRLVPTTARVLMELTGGLSAELAAEPNRWLIVPLFVVFFAGELVWREREAGVNEIGDAMPGSEWTPLLGKLLGLGLVLVLFTTLQMAAGMAAQTLLGHHDLELGLYLTILFGLQLPEYLLFAVLALVIHVVVDQKYVGHLAAILAYAFVAVLAGRLGIEHDLIVYGTGPAWSYTEIRGFAGSVGPWLWFKGYWAAWALLLAVVARLFWVRGREDGIRVRLRTARRRFGGPTARTAATGTVLLLATGGALFYDTNVRNEYRSSEEIRELRAEYERRYRQYEDLPQPRMTGADLRVEIYPERRAVEITGSYRLRNDTGEAIESIHVSPPTGGAETRELGFDRPTEIAVLDEQHAYRIYSLDAPLRPGEALRLDFVVRVEPRGFASPGVERFVVPNGTYFTNASWFPSIGYQRFRELLTPADRREHGLPPRPVLASLYEVEGREPASRGGGVSFEAVVGTSEDQVAVAPGALRRTWTESGRRYFHYETDAPIGGEWAFFSADYRVREARWNDVAIRIHHDPEHTAHLDRTTRIVRASLEFYTRELGPYPYRHLTIVEQPAGMGTGAHADPSLISHGQGFAYWIPRSEADPDVPFYVMAHEMAHQWTVPYALAEGLPFLSEGLATYLGAQVVEAALGEAQYRRLLGFMRQPYPFRPIRHGEPLLRALDPYLSRRRGPFALVALNEYVGEDRVHGAIRRLIEEHDAPGTPPATTLDFYRELRAVTPASRRGLLRDLFEVNTICELGTERATAVETESGTWEVTLDVRARKTTYDSEGSVTELPMEEPVQIGIFASSEAGNPRPSEPLYLGMHRIRSGEHTVTVTVSRRPALAGIDPNHLLDWEGSGEDDNLVEVEVR